MPHYFDFDSVNKILRCRLEGDVTDESLKDCYLAAAQVAALTNPRVGLMDFSGVSSVNVSAETVRDLAYHPPAMPGPAPRFLVTPSDCLYGLARMFQQCGSEQRPELHVVRTLDEAYSFIGVREPWFKPLGGVVTIRNRSGAPAPQRVPQPS